MADHYIGSKISLISKAQIRYEGILFAINSQDATVSLSKGKFSKIKMCIFFYLGHKNNIHRLYVLTFDLYFDS